MKPRFELKAAMDAVHRELDASLSRPNWVSRLPSDRTCLGIGRSWRLVEGSVLQKPYTLASLA
jgi:hypothetical protein